MSLIAYLDEPSRRDGSQAAPPVLYVERPRGAELLAVDDFGHVTEVHVLPDGAEPLYTIGEALELVRAELAKEKLSEVARGRVELALIRVES